MKSYWTWAKIRLSYLANKGICYRVLLEWVKKFIYLISLTKKNMKELYWTWTNGNFT